MEQDAPRILRKMTPQHQTPKGYLPRSLQIPRAAKMFTKKSIANSAYACYPLPGNGNIRMGTHPRFSLLLLWPTERVGGHLPPHVGV